MDTKKKSVSIQPGEIGELQDTLLAEMRQTAKTLMAAVEEYLGISLARHRVFELLYPANEVSQAALERRLGVDGAVITRLVKQMEGEGLLTRRPDPADNRFTLVALTPAAQQFIEEMLVKRRGVEEMVMEGIDAEDTDCMRRILARMRQNAEKIAAIRPEGRPGESRG